MYTEEYDDLQTAITPPVVSNFKSYNNSTIIERHRFYKNYFT